jgi:hypothetical protein
MKSVTITTRDGKSKDWAVPDRTSHVIIARKRLAPETDPVIAPVDNQGMVAALIKYTNNGRKATAYPVVAGKVREDS